mgnify:CR=1 FL=1
MADGKFVTGHACGSSFDFGLKLVEVLRGKEAADEINGRIFYTAEPRRHYAPGCGRRSLPFPLRSAEPATGPCLTAFCPFPR